MRQDQYPPLAGPVTGNEPITTVDANGNTVNINPAAMVPYMQAQLQAWVMSLGFSSGGSNDALTDGTAALTDDSNSALTE